MTFAKDVNLNDDDLLRYSRQIMLPQIEVSGQKKLLESKVLIFGAGGLGSPIAMYLCASGIGELVIVDPDVVDLSNLQRQIIHRTEFLGKDKTVSAMSAINGLNPNTKVRTVNRILNDSELELEVEKADVVVDATDNFAARFSINACCVKKAKPLIVGAAVRFEGQVAVFDMQNNSPCYHCLYPNQGELDESCTNSGILGSVVGIIGCIQATEVIKTLVNIGSGLSSKLLLFDALNMDWHIVKVIKDSSCPVCSG